MKAVVQRVLKSELYIDGQKHSSIEKGLLVLIGIAKDDQETDVLWMSRKLAHLRIFSDEEGKMNLSLLDINGELLLVSQFTLQANTQKGNRPSFIEAAPPNQAIPLYEQLIRELSKLIPRPIATGVFGADMQISLINDGPVTIILDSKSKV